MSVTQRRKDHFMPALLVASSYGWLLMLASIYAVQKLRDTGLI